MDDERRESLRVLGGGLLKPDRDETRPGWDRDEATEYDRFDPETRILYETDKALTADELVEADRIARQQDAEAAEAQRQQEKLDRQGALEREVASVRSFASNEEEAQSVADLGNDYTRVSAQRKYLTETVGPTLKAAAEQYRAQGNEQAAAHCEASLARVRQIQDAQEADINRRVMEGQQKSQLKHAQADVVEFLQACPSLVTKNEEGGLQVSSEFYEFKNYMLAQGWAWSDLVQLKDKSQLIHAHREFKAKKNDRHQASERRRIARTVPMETRGRGSDTTSKAARETLRDTGSDAAILNFLALERAEGKAGLR